MVGPAPLCPEVVRHAAKGVGTGASARRARATFDPSPAATSSTPGGTASAGGRPVASPQTTADAAASSSAAHVRAAGHRGSSASGAAPDARIASRDTTQASPWGKEVATTVGCARAGDRGRRAASAST